MQPLLQTQVSALSFQIFLILWFWYFILTMFGVTRLIYRSVQIASRRFRYYVMRVRISRYFKSDKNLKHVEHYITR